MKHKFAILFILLALLIGSVSVVGAQDADPGDTAPVATVEALPVATQVVIDAPDTVIVQPVSQPAAPSAFPDIGTFIIMFLTFLVGVDRISNGLFSRKALDIAARYVDPKIAGELYESAFQKGLQYSLNQAAQTPGTDDDEFWLAQARSQGFTITKNEQGHYLLSKPLAQTDFAVPAG